MKALTRLVPALGALLLMGVAPAPGTSVAVAPVATFPAAGPSGMLFPTGVAVDPAGRVWVADGANDRLMVFEKDGSLGQIVRRAAGVALSRPMALATSTDGRVWVVDSGNNRIVVLGTAAATETSLVVGKELGRVDLTDIDVAPDGSRAWVVDNDGNRVLSVTVATGKWEARGSKGAAAGAFNHPRGIAVDSKSRPWVSDVLNGRIERLEPTGRGAAVMVKYGVSPGQVYRPSGIDVVEDRVWVADSVLGVIQVFTTDGVYIDAVRDNQGHVLHLAGPIAVKVVGDKLYVVEAKANRVSQYTIQAGSGTPLRAGESKSTTSTASEGQECTLCHLDLIAPLDAGVATALVSPPKKDKGQSWAGTETACISCHDGAVLDSRRHIWSGYAHPRGSAASIPATMKIPAEVPLVNGEIACRTCHSPHSLGGSAQQHRGATMLRVERGASEICVACHGSKGGM